MEEPELGALKMPQETQFPSWLASERSMRHGHEHGSDVGQILSALARLVHRQRTAPEPLQQESGINQMPSVSVNFPPNC